MGYIESSLLPGERIVARAHLHRIVFVKALLVGLAGIALLYWQPLAGASIALIGLAMAVPPFITAKSSEFGVTDKRVVIKIGVVRRRTVELLLRQIEAISVDQTVAGRLLNYGSITLTGTGGVKETFQNIARPLEFRRHIQGQSVAEGEEGPSSQRST